MKIINISDKPYEWTFDSNNYGPVMPGVVWDGPDEVARHALKRSQIVDDEGEITGFRMASLADMDRETIKAVATYPCPFSMTNQCDSEPFKSIDDLKKHLDSHWGAATTPANVITGLEPVLAGKAPARK